MPSQGAEFRFLSCPSVYGSAASDGECDQYAGALGWHDGERRRLPSKTEHPAAHHDPACDYECSRRFGRSVSADQDACADFSSRFFPGCYLVRRCCSHSASILRGGSPQESRTTPQMQR